MKESGKDIVLGLMSGTSLDGLDLALCRFSENNGRFDFSVLKAETLAYPAVWKNVLQKAPQLGAESFCELDHLYGCYLAAQSRRFLSGTPAKTQLIASHGHTIFHRPEKGFSTQIGCGAAIAAKTGIATVCDFRSLDVALNGQGAPLVPVGDKLLFGKYDGCLNLGGISNISFDKNGKRIAFDICPVNMALNFYAQQLGKEYDAGGQLAAAGKTSSSLLNELNALAFYKQDAPRSLGREWFETVMMPVLKKHRLPVNDVLSTLCEHIAQQIAQVLNSNRIKNVLVSGGGTFNSLLLLCLAKKYKGQLVIPDETTINYKEAIIFAFLGWLRINNKINTLSSVTGAVADSCGGAVYKPLL